MKQSSRQPVVGNYFEILQLLDQIISMSFQQISSGFWGVVTTRNYLFKIYVFLNSNNYVNFVLANASQ